jgi:hypothetical protein
MRFTVAEKKKITAEYASRYRIARKAEKTKLLDEYLRLAGGNRKYAIFKLNRIGKTQLRVIDGEHVVVKMVEKSRKKRVYKPYYDGETVKMLLRLWQDFNWQCGKLFAPFLRQNLDIIRARGKYKMTDDAAAKLKQISPRHIDRLLRRLPSSSSNQVQKVPASDAGLLATCRRWNRQRSWRGDVCQP